MRDRTGDPAGGAEPAPPVAAADLEEAARARLRRHGLRDTESRRRVVRVLAEAGRPLTLPQMLAADDGLSQSSAYRNLSELAGAGVVDRIVTGEDRSHFELAHGLTDNHHHHLVCGSCGAVADIELTPRLESMVDREAALVGRARGWIVEDHRLDLVGRCATCAAGPAT